MSACQAVSTKWTALWDALLVKGEAVQERVMQGEEATRGNRERSSELVLVHRLFFLIQYLLHGDSLDGEGLLYIPWAIPAKISSTACTERWCEPLQRQLMESHATRCTQQLTPVQSASMHTNTCTCHMSAHLLPPTHMLDLKPSSSATYSARLSTNAFHSSAMRCRSWSTSASACMSSASSSSSYLQPQAQAFDVIHAQAHQVTQARRLLSCIVLQLLPCACLSLKQLPTFYVNYPYSSARVLPYALDQGADLKDCSYAALFWQAQLRNSVLVQQCNPSPHAPKALAKLLVKPGFIN